MNSFTFKSFGALVSLLLALSACGKQTPNSAAPPAPTARTVTVTEIVERPMAGSLTASGVLVPREEIAVGSELGGYRVAEVLVEEGAAVKRGQVLARIDSGLLQARIEQARAQLQQAQAQAAQSIAEAKRVAGLDGTGILSDEQIGSRRAQAKSAEASVAVARAQLKDLQTQLKRLVIRAPAGGTVLEKTVRRGDVASPGQPMFRMAREQLIELDAEVPEQALAGIAAGKQAAVTLPSGETLQGQVRLVSPRVDPQSKLGRVRVALPRHDGLRPGGYARAEFHLAAAAVPAVPEKAVLFEAAGPMLVVIDKNNQARRVSVKTGARDDGFVAIESAPPVGTRVALGGGAFLLDGDAVDPVPLAGGAPASPAQISLPPAAQGQS